MSTTTLRPSVRRTLSGKLVDNTAPRLTWQDLIHTGPQPAAAPVIGHRETLDGRRLAEHADGSLTAVPITFRDLADGDAFRFVDGITGQPVGSTYTRRNRQGWYESTTGGIKLRTGVNVTVVRGAASAA